jgi:large subunit ribosomal protein L10
MAKTKAQKEIALKDFVARVKKSKSLVFVNFDKLKVKEIEEFRKKCRQEKVDYLVAKKTLMKIGLKEAGYADVDSKNLEKGIATLFGLEDEVAPARISQEFGKTHEAMATVGGVLEGKYIDKNRVIELSKLPSRPELLAKVVGSIQAPVSGFVRVLSGNLRNFVYVLNAIKESK